MITEITDPSQIESVVPVDPAEVDFHQAPAPSAGGQASNPERQALDFFQARGWTREQAAGIVGNLAHESAGMDPYALGDGTASFGLAQWNKDRRRSLFQFAAGRGETLPSFETQLEFVDHELNGDEQQAGLALRNTRSVEEAAQTFSEFYERPGKPMLESRIQRAYAALGGGTPMTPAGRRYKSLAKAVLSIWGPSEAEAAEGPEGVAALGQPSFYDAQGRPWLDITPAGVQGGGGMGTFKFSEQEGEKSLPEGVIEVKPEDVSFIDELAQSAKNYAAFGGMFATSGLAAFSRTLANAAEYVAQLTGTEPGGLFREAEKELESYGEWWRGQIRNPSPIEEVVGGAAGGAIPGATQFAMGVPYAAAQGYFEGGVRGMIQEVIRRAAMGGLLKATGGLSMPSRAVATGWAFGAEAASRGASPGEIGKAAATGGLMAAAGGPGGKPVKESMENFVKSLPRRLQEETGALGGQRATGWDKAQGKFSSLYDTRPRFEIDDSKARLKESEFKEYGESLRAKATTLGEVYEHPELFKQYPELKDVNVNIRINPKLKPSGSFAEDLIAIEARDFASARESLTHEIQHWIQQKEGFARGGSPQNVVLAMPGRQGDVARRLKEIQGSLRNPLSKERRDELFQEHTDLVAEWKGFDNSPQTQYENYRKLAGEIEARDVAQRANLTPESREKIPPYSTEDISPEEAIVRFGKGKAAQVEKGPDFPLTKENIPKLYDYAMANRWSGKTEIVYGKVTPEEAARLKEVSGQDLDGYNHAVDNFAMRHMQLRHGDAKTEESKGQIAITREDVARIPEIVASPDSVVPLKTKIGRDGFGYTKRVNGSIFYVEEIRTKRKTLSAVSMRKYRAGATDVTPSRDPRSQSSETLPGHDIDSIAEEIESGNPVTRILSDESGFIDIGGMWDETLRWIAPTMRGPEAARTGRTLSENESRMARAMDQFLRAAKPIEKAFSRSTPAENLDFMQRMDTGQKQPTKQLQAVADWLQKLFKERVEAVQALGTGALDQVRENYFPHVWKRGAAGIIPREGGEIPEKVKPYTYPEAAKGTSRRPMEGGKSFTRQRVWDDVMTGIEAGAEPVSYNPLDLVALKLREMDKYISAIKSFQALRATGDMKFLKTSQPMPQGWEKVSDKYGTVWRPIRDSEGNITGRTISGYFIAPEPVAQVINNYLSEGLYNSKYFGTLFTHYMSAANSLNMFQLGVGSMFHAGFTSMESVISHAALGIKQASQGRVVDALKSFVESPVAFVTNPLFGRQILREWYEPGSTNPHIARIVEGINQAGGQFGIDRMFETNHWKKMIEAWHEGTITGKLASIARSPFAFCEMSTVPLLKWLVPAQKAGVFGNLAQDWLKANPNATTEEQAIAMRQIWNRVDSRLGQVVYSRLFVHNVAKNVAQAVMRAPGWKGGTIVEFGGAVKDVGEQFIRMTEGKPPELTDRMAYVLAMALTSGVINGTMTLLLTGDDVKELKPMDFLAFRTGRKDKNGNDVRFVSPTYLKDLFAYASKGFLHPLLAATNPLINLISESFANRDYYGVEVRHPDDPIWKEVLQEGQHVAKAFTPFWVRGYMKANETTGTPLAEKLAPLFGFMPATGEYTKSKAFLKAEEFRREKAPQGTRTKEQAEKSEMIGKFKERIRAGDETVKADVNRAVAEGSLKRDDRNKLRKAARTTPFQDIVKSLGAKEAMKVHELSDARERAMIHRIVQKKVRNSDTLTREERLIFKKMLKE